LLNRSGVVADPKFFDAVCVDSSQKDGHAETIFAQAHFWMLISKRESVITQNDDKFNLILSS
jgi:hypothetical protein